MKTVLSIGVAVLIIGLLVVFYAEITGVLTRFRLALSAAGDPSFTYDAFRDLEREREELNARLESSVSPGAASHAYTSLTARVYSRYPVGGGGRFTLNVGSEDGVREGAPVLLSEGTLVGKVVTVRRTQSEVETIWSPSWKSAVSLGPAKLKALLQGGSEPRLELVPREPTLAGGERVLNLSPDFPLGLLLGTVGGPLAGSQNDLWSSYRLLPLAAEGELEVVLVALDFP